MTHAPMQYVPVASALRRPYVVIEEAVTLDEAAEIDRIALEMHGALAPAKIGPGGGFDYDRRSASVGWVANVDATRWLFTLVMERIQRANLFFGLDVWGMVEELQYSEYNVDDRFCWHTDYGIHSELGGVIGAQPAPPRKVSFTLQLSDPTEYEGGDLELLVGDFGKMPRERRTMIVFPSYTVHRVAPITRGRRRSLVGWACGPDLR